MNKFISTLLAASLMLFGTQAFAQMSVNAGYLNSTQSFKDASTKSINSNGAYAGVSFNIPVAGGLGFAPGVYYSMIANKSESSGTIMDIPVTASSTFMEHALNAPLYLNYGIDLARDSKVFIYGGPTVQFGLASTTKLSGGVGESTADRTYNNYDNKNYSRFNVYLGGGVGFQLSAFQITLGYDYGMLNLYKGESATRTHRSNLKVGIGYVF